MRRFAVTSGELKRVFWKSHMCVVQVIIICNLDLLVSLTRFNYMEIICIHMCLFQERRRPCLTFPLTLRNSLNSTRHRWVCCAGAYAPVSVCMLMDYVSVVLGFFAASINHKCGYSVAWG